MRTRNNGAGIYGNMVISGCIKYVKRCVSDIDKIDAQHLYIWNYFAQSLGDFVKATSLVARTFLLFHLQNV